jgi:hypothetical protein
MDRLTKITRAALVAVLAIHALLALRFEPIRTVFGPDPIATIDYDTHYEQTMRALEAFRNGPRLWGYDPHLLAGSISGAIFDADTRLHELFVIALDRLGVAPHRAYNLFILLVHLMMPLAIYGSARLFRMGEAAATVATALASACWYFDGFSHWVFWVGMISYGLAGYLAALPIALFYRYVEDRKRQYLAATLVLLVIIHHVHPYSFFILAVPMVALYVWHRRDLTRAEHASVWVVVGLTLLANLWWLRAALRFWHYVLDSAFYLDATLAYLVSDFFGLLREPSTTGVLAMRSGFRVLATASAVCALIAWRKQDDRRYRLFALGLGVLLGAAYLGGYSSVLRQVQPYRFSLPATYLACIPAGAFLVDAAGELRKIARRRLALLLGAVVAIVGMRSLARDVLYFLPELVPRHARKLPAPPPNINGAIALGTIQWPEPFDYSHQPLGDIDHALSDAVRQRDDGSGRFLVEWWMLGERFAWATNAQILGGFREINLAHSDANWFRRYDDGKPHDPKELARYLEQYNVKWVIVTNSTPALEERADLFELDANVFGTRFYRTKIRSSFIVGGGPGTVRARMDRIEVRGSAGGDLVLRYHYLETLECRPAVGSPPCQLHRVPLTDDRVGFIGVSNAPADFDIVNP